MVFWATHSSPIGALTLASDGRSLIGLWMEGQKYHGATLGDATTENDGLRLFGVVRKWLDQYFDGKNPIIDAVPLAPRGSGFRRSVWNALCKIPYGEVTTYGEIGKRLAAKEDKVGLSARAVGGAVGHNPISIIIPCHRVVGAGGSLTGYAGGLTRKIRLLEIEGVDTARFSVPQKGTAL